MFSFLRNAQKSLSQLETLIKLAEQVVLALEQTASASGPDKKRLALQMLAELARLYGLDPPQLVLDTVIEAAVRLTKKQ
jgi:hypothetical protein